MTEDETAGWHHRLDGHGFEQAPGDGGGQGCLACCGSWARKEWEVTAIEPTSLHHQLMWRQKGKNQEKILKEFSLRRELLGSTPLTASSYISINQCSVSVPCQQIMKNTREVSATGPAHRRSSENGVRVNASSHLP